jgi:hypothetical protein
MATMATVLVRPRPDRRPEIVDRIRLEYQQLPGLALTATQAQRLWHIEATTCRHLLDLLVADGYLREGEDARYRRQTIA